MRTIYLILLIFAAICFLLAALSCAVHIGARRRPINLIALGLLAWVLVSIIVLART